MGLIFKVPHPKGLEPTIFPIFHVSSSHNPGELLNRSNHSNDSLVFNFPIYLVHQGYKLPDILATRRVGSKYLGNWKIRGLPLHEHEGYSPT